MDRHEYLLGRVKAAVSDIQRVVRTMHPIALKPPMPAKAFYLDAQGMDQIAQLIATLNTDITALESEIDDLVDEQS